MPVSGLVYNGPCLLSFALAGCPVPALPFVAVCGSRSLPSSFGPLVASVVRSVAAAGRGVCVGCSSGADALAVSAVAALPSSLLWRSALWVFCAGPASELPPAVRGCARPWAGGPASLPLRARLAARSAACVRFAAASGPRAGLVCFGLSPSSRGSLLACSLAVSLGLPVVVFPCGSPLAVLGPGAWSPAGSGVWASAVRWAPASLFAGVAC